MGSKFDIKLWSYDQIDPVRWDQAQNKKGAEIYSSYQYLSIISQGNWSAAILGDYEATVPFICRRKWGLIPYVTMPIFSQKYSNNDWTAESWGYLIQKLRSQVVKIDLRTTLSFFEDDKTRTNFVLHKNTRSYQEIYEGYKKELKRKLKQTQGYEIDKIPQDLAISFLQDHPLFRKLTPPRAGKILDKLCDHHMLHFIGLHHAGNNELVSVLGYLVYGLEAYILLPYQSVLGKEINGMAILIDYLIQQDEFQTINFEGSSIPSIARFYEQFGPEKQIYYASSQGLMSIISLYFR